MHRPTHRPISNQSMGWRFHTVRGGIDPGDHCFVPGLLGLYMYGRIYDPGLVSYPPRMSRDLDIVPRGNTRRLYERQPINNRWMGVEFRYGAVSTRGIIAFVPGL